MTDLCGLNSAQHEAVLTTEGPLLVLAGAGSGKTRVLTYRIAHLVEDCGVAPWNILAVTFTNKAAREMRERLFDLVPGGCRGMWVATFHSMCVRILRKNAELLGFTDSFTIYDDDESKRLVKAVMEDLRYDPKFYPEKGVRGKISSAKNELMWPAEYATHAKDPLTKCAADVYAELQRRLQRANAMDFDDLLLYAHKLLSENAEVRRGYAEAFRYIMVDEYQDTNKAQYAITQLLASVHGNLMVVGDDDQSIYSWRGADIRNILDFEKDWPAAKVVKLEQNYRSTANILDAANAVIANNRGRKAKKLFTAGEAGEKIALYLAADERDEGRWIAGEIEKLHDAGKSYNQVALFYRTNAQSRTLEDMLLRAGVPYKIVGGTRFFERAEVRDVMAYLKLAVNPADDVSAARVINTPRRGIGKTTIDRIQHTANVHGCTFLQACEMEAGEPTCRAATRSALTNFLLLVREAGEMEGELDSIVEMIIEKSGLIAALKAQRTDEAQSRIENIREFVGVVKDYMEAHDETVEEPVEGAPELLQEEAPAAPTLPAFMEWLSLRTDLDSVADSDESITLMTIHTAKGLEFDYVFLSGAEESIFPSQMAVMEGNLEEERRLAYVAITRARKKLHITHAQTRRLYGGTQSNPRSRFVTEIPKGLLAAVGVGSAGLSGTGWEKRGDRHSTYGSGRGEQMYGGHVFGSGGSRKKPAAETFAAGDEVDHKTFGRGTVKAVDGDKLQVYFHKTGQTKTLLKGYAPIVKVG